MLVPVMLAGWKEGSGLSGTSLAARLLGRSLSRTDARQRVVPRGHWRTSFETFTTGKERWAFLSPVESHFQ